MEDRFLRRLRGARFERVFRPGNPLCRPGELLVRHLFVVGLEISLIRLSGWSGILQDRNVFALMVRTTRNSPCLSAYRSIRTAARLDRGSE